MSKIHAAIEGSAPEFDVLKLSQVINSIDVSVAAFVLVCYLELPGTLLYFTTLL